MLGQPAPAFAVRSVNGPALIDLDALRGKPTVLAFMPSWHHGLAGSEAMSAVRAELRKLGAVLVLISRQGLLCFRPVDDIQRCIAADALDAESVRATCAAYDVSLDAQDDAHALTLFVVDGKRRLRFACAQPAHGSTDSIAIPHTSPVSALADALGIAGRSLSARSPAFSLTHRELVISSLVSSFALTFLRS